MDYHAWVKSGLRVLIPPKEAREAVGRLEEPEDPFLAALLPHAAGIQFEIGGMTGKPWAFGSESQFDTLRASLTVEEARDLAQWILETID